MNNPDFDPQSSALLEKNIDCVIDDNRNNESVRVIKRRNNDIVYEVHADSGGLLVVGEVSYPGWKATIDGKRSKTLRADYAL